MSFPSIPWTITRHQFFTLPPAPSGDLLKGQTVIITGATSGIGLEAAKQLVLLSPSILILAVRNVEQGEKLALELTKLSKGIVNVQIWFLDVMDFSSVFKFIERALKELERLDVLINNAGINPTFAVKPYKASGDGYERTLQTNVISPILLALSLQPLLEMTRKIPNSPKPRLIFTGSDGHVVANHQPIAKAVKEHISILEQFNKEEGYDNPSRYFQSKLLLQMVTTSLITSLPEYTIINVNPGQCRTNLGREFELTPSFALLKGILTFLVVSRSSYAGAKSLSTAAVFAEESHSYWTECQPWSSENIFLPSLTGILATRQFFKELLQEIEKIRPGSTGGLA